MSDATRRFFDEMAGTYDADLEVLGWDSRNVVREWPFVVPAGARVLDAGCGTGPLLEELAGAGRELTGFDLSAEMIRQARRRSALHDASLLVSSADEPLPFSDASFDILFAFGMLEFVPSLDSTLAELGRVLVPGGKGLISVEDIYDWEGNERERLEYRYARFKLWRRSADEIDICLPADVRITRRRRMPAYHVVERGFTAAYHVLEIERRA